MQPRIDEIADRNYRISIYFPPEEVPPRGFTVNQFLIDAEEPLLYHTGMRQVFRWSHRPWTPWWGGAAAVDRILAHRGYECGAMNAFSRRARTRR
jgi:hypothetical protein